MSVDVPPRTRFARSLFAGIARDYDRMGGLLSFGQDGRWRRFMISRLASLPEGARVLDVATGTGLVAREIVRRRPDVRVIGADQSEPMVAGARTAMDLEGATGRIALALGQAERLPFADASFDAVTFTYLLRYVEDPAATLVELARVLKPGGVMANLEFHVPPQPWRALWIVYTRLVLPALGRLASRQWYETGRFLGPSISSFYAKYPPPYQLLMWRGAGLGEVWARTMSLGGGVVIWGTKAHDKHT